MLLAVYLSRQSKLLTEQTEQAPARIPLHFIAREPGRESPRLTFESSTVTANREVRLLMAKPRISTWLWHPCSNGPSSTLRTSPVAANLEIGSWPQAAF